MDESVSKVKAAVENMPLINWERSSILPSSRNFGECDTVHCFSAESKGGVVIKIAYWLLIRFHDNEDETTIESYDLFADDMEITRYYENNRSSDDEDRASYTTGGDRWVRELFHKILQDESNNEEKNKIEKMSNLLNKL